MQFREVKISDINISNNRRKVDPEKTRELADSIQKIGLLNPISVTRDRKLIAGLHRIEAYRLLSLETIDANVLDFQDELRTKLAQIDENYVRNEGTVLERAEMLNERKKIYLQLYPETRQGVAGGKARHGAANEIISFAEDTSEKTRKSKRTIEQDIQIANDITDEVRRQVEETEIADSKIELLTLAKQDEKTQKKIADRITSGKVESVKEAIQQIKKEERLANFKTGERHTNKLHLLNGDLFKVDIPDDFNLIIADFPYDISEEGKSSKVGNEIVNFDAGEWDKDFDIKAAIEYLSKKLLPGGSLVFFADKIAMSHLWDYCKEIGLIPKNIITWHKTNPPPNARRNFMSATEFILWAVKPGALYTWNGDATTPNHIESPICSGFERLDHPTQKPIVLIKWLIDLFSDPTDKILDPCAGVGTTGATDLDREFWLIEKDKDYFIQMEDRLTA